MRRLKVLIADATTSVRQFIRFTLMNNFSNIEIHVASNGKNIKKRLEDDTRYDLIIYDREMPLLSGDELLEWLRKHETLKSTPLIMMSVDRDESSIRKAIQLGANAYLIKPLLMDHLVGNVRDVFNKSSKATYDRRRFERFRSLGNVFLRYDSKDCRGKLINISMGGILSSFESKDSLPHILDKVGTSIELANKQGIEGIEGVVVRMQVVDTLSGPRQIYLALDFSEDISTDKRKELADLVSFLNPRARTV
ncbi:MAG TPA: response regulator [Nitrospirae bacterium]|nr:chemotaxis protein CheY [bacterium BMS3Abin06]HDH10671.1 response regulator [Nitrospirota bacterium]HDZ01499.1 response regulator [Nitrospirota bacterium]